MPKSLDIDPARLAAGRQALAMPTIPVYAYRASIAEERAQRDDATLVKVLRDMLIVREFESMLQALRGKGEYQGITLPYRGPAHLSVGQEGAAVGLALALAPSDHVYGNHRSHGEFLAKGLAAIAALGDNDTRARMAAHADGSLLHTVERCLGDHDGAGGEALAIDFLLFGFLSEILMRATGFNGGMGGSMHAFFPPFGSLPNNAIVGASAGIATGAALAMRGQAREAIAVATAGDGSTGCGPVWEAMNFAAMAQFDTLWPAALRGGLPVLFFFTNNFYAMGGQTIGETMGWERLSRIGAGVRADALHAETVDGTRPLAVADAVARARTRLLAGEGPCLLDIECYRQSGHSTSDANAYRSREELKAWAGHDAIARYADELIEDGVIGADALERLSGEVQALVTRIVTAVADESNAPPVDIRAEPLLIGELMFAPDGAAPAARQPSHDVDLAACSRVRQNAKKARHALDQDGRALSPMRAITLRDALFEAILDAMLADRRLLAWGEECREWGGAFGVYRGLSDLFDHSRLFNSPISEAAIVATAVGHALEGGRSLVELMYADFIGRAGDEILNQMAKWRAMSGGTLGVPVVLRCSVGSKYGAQHSQDWSALCAHVPGLKVMYPATPFDAKGLLAAALAGDDPVVFFESQRLYDVTERFVDGGVPVESYTIEPGKPALRREGSEATILTIGPSLYPVLEAADTLQTQYETDIEVIDARCLVPFDYAPLIASVEKTGRLLIVSEASERGSFAMTLAATVSRMAHDKLAMPVRVLGAPNWIVPGAEMESTYFPGVNDVLDVVLGEWFAERDAAARTRGVRGQDPIALARRGL